MAKPTKVTLKRYELFKPCKRASSKIRDQLRHVKERALAAGRKERGWTFQLERTTKENEGYRTTIILGIHKAGYEDQADEIFNKVILPAANVTGWGTNVPKVVSPITIGLRKDLGLPDAEQGFAIPEDWRDYYSHIFGLDDQIYIVVKTIQAFIESNYRNRFHITLYGPPGCGKTEIVRATKAMLGSDNVIEYDATATTAAGAIGDLANKDDSPRILVTEELEKADETSMRWLLGALDQRAELRKVTARTNINKKLKILTIATVNDKKLFDKAMAGALSSRFALKLHCPRPSREIHKQILTREIERFDGNIAWANKAIDLADELGTTDPRMVTALCMVGGEDLLSGEFQRRLKNVTKLPKVVDNSTDK